MAWAIPARAVVSLTLSATGVKSFIKTEGAAVQIGAGNTGSGKW